MTDDKYGTISALKKEAQKSSLTFLSNNYMASSSVAPLCSVSDVQKFSSVDIKNGRLSRRQLYTDVAVAAPTGGGSPVGDVVGGALPRRRTVACLTGVSSTTKLPRCVRRQSQDNTVNLLPGWVGGGQCPLPAASVHTLCKQNGTSST